MKSAEVWTANLYENSMWKQMRIKPVVAKPISLYGALLMETIRANTAARCTRYNRCTKDRSTLIHMDVEVVAAQSTVRLVTLAEFL